MYRKINIKTLFILFSVLLAMVVIVQIANRKRGDKSFRGTLTAYETEQVDKILITPKAMAGETLELRKEGGQWHIAAHDKKIQADQRLAGSIVSNLNRLQPDGVVSDRKERWNDFEVGDSASTHVQLFHGEQTVADLYLGKYSFSPGGGKSYVRPAKEKTIYRINSSVSSDLNRDRNGFRDKTVLKTKAAELSKLTFTYPADSSFVLEKQEGKWLVGGQEADSAKVATFINSLAQVNHYQFAKETPAEAPDFRLTVETTIPGTPAEVKGYLRPEDQFVVSTSQNPDAWFEGKTLRDKLFPPSSKFRTNP